MAAALPEDNGVLADIHRVAGRIHCPGHSVVNCYKYTMDSPRLARPFSPNCCWNRDQAILYPPLAQTLEAKSFRGCTKGAFSDWGIIERSVQHMRKGIIPTGFQMVWKKVLPNEAIHRILRIVNNDALKTANPKGSGGSSNMGMGRRGPVRMTV